MYDVLEFDARPKFDQTRDPQIPTWISNINTWIKVSPLQFFITAEGKKKEISMKSLQIWEAAVNWFN